MAGHHDVTDTPAAVSAEGGILSHWGLLHMLAAKLAASFATQVQSVVVGWQIYALTHDPLSLGYVGLAQFVPMFLLVLPAGDIADRVPRRVLLAFSWLTQAMAGALLLGFTLHGETSPVPFYGALALFGVGRAFTGPSAQALLPLLVPERLLGKAIAWNSSSFQIAVITGPAVGGALYLLGPAVAYGLCLTLFLAAGLSAPAIRQHRAQLRAGGKSTALQRVAAGLSYIRHRPIILGAISLDLFAVLLGGATALLPVYAHDILHVGPEGLGALRSAVAVGAFAVALYLGHRSLVRHAGMVMFACVAAFGAATIVFGLSQSFVLSLIALFVVGASDMISVYVRSTLIQLATPDEMRGRVSAVNMLFIGASNELGEFESGVTAAWFGPVAAVVIGGVGTLAVVGLWMSMFPSLRRVDRLHEVGSATG